MFVQYANNDAPWFVMLNQNTRCIPVKVRRIVFNVININVNIFIFYIINIFIFYLIVIFNKCLITIFIDRALY